MRHMVIAQDLNNNPVGRTQIAPPYHQGVATLVVDGSDLVVKMSELEKFEALHPDVRVPLSAIREIRAVDEAWPELRGIRAPGTGIPGVIAVGTRRGSFGKDFVVVHGKEPAVVVELADATYSRIVVTTPDADRVATEIRGQLMPSITAPPAP
jgi:hypothetical protein